MREWMDEALCVSVDPDVFMLEKGESSREAKRICALCPVNEQCLEYAMSQEDLRELVMMPGIYAGLSPKERAALRKQS